MKLPQEIIDLIFFYVHRMKQETIIQQMHNCLFYSDTMLFLDLKEVVGKHRNILSLKCRYQFRCDKDAWNDRVPIPLRYLDICNSKSDYYVKNALPRKYFYTSGFNHPSAYKNAY